MDQSPVVATGPALHWQDESLPSHIRRKLWRDENRAAIESMNAWVAQHGLPGESLTAADGEA